MARKKTIPAEEAGQEKTLEALEQESVQQTEEIGAAEILPPEDVAVTGSDPPLAEEASEVAPSKEAQAETPMEDGEAEGEGGGAPEWTAADMEQAGGESPDPAREGDGMEVLSVDFSEPAAIPKNDEAVPDDWAQLSEDPASEVPIASLTVPLMPAGDEAPGTMPPDGPSAPVKSDRQKFYELKFNELDRYLTPEERQEWNSIYASYRGRSALTGTVVGADSFSVLVRDPKSGAMEKQTMFCAVVVLYRVRIVIPATEMWENAGEMPDYVLRATAGASISFIITKVDREGGFAIASRRLAARSQRYFFAHRPNLHTAGTRLKCRMLAVGPRRCLVECYGHDIGMTQRDLNYTAIPNLRNEYRPGQEEDCIVKSYDPDTGKLVISVKETKSNPFDGAEQRHPVGARRLAMIAGKYGGGVFCNLPDGTVCMCNYSYQHEDSDFVVGDHVMLIVQRYDDVKKQMYGKIVSKW